MFKRRSVNVRVGGIAMLVALAAVIAGCGSSTSRSSSTAAAATDSSSTAASATATPSSSTTATPSTPTAASTSGAGASIGTAKGPDGTYLTADDGRALYLWVADAGGRSNCAGACATAWPPLITKGKPVAGSGVTAADLGTTMRSDGTEQVTYNRHPLYFFIADKAAGQTTGQGSNGFGAKWWLVAPSGVAITAADPSGGSSSGPSGGSSNGPSGGSSSSSSSGWG
jgi:predicted lipoprotein with Yx(FWY)xxD motif